MASRTVYFVSPLLLFATVAPGMLCSQSPKLDLQAYLNGQVEGAEKHMLEVAQAMPEANYDFRPLKDTFKDARTFSEQLNMSPRQIVPSRRLPLTRKV